MSKLSRYAVRQEIRKLNRLDPDRAAYDAIISTYRKITNGLSVVVGLSGGHELFYRARISVTKPQLVAEVQAPPARSVVGYQRCNPPGIPMFYAASKRLGALLETRVSEGDLVYLSQWIGRGRIPVNRIFDNEKDQVVDGKSASTLIGPNDDLLLSYLDTQFTRRIHESFSNDYKFTSAIAQNLTCNFPPNDEHDVHSDGHVALKYPSVLGLDAWHNTAMHAAFATKRLEPLHVMELRVLNADSGSAKVEVLDTATNFSDGKIHWTSDPSRVPKLLKANRAVPFIFHDEKWNLQLFEGPVTPEYVDALLVE